MVADGEAMALVADELDEMEHGRSAEKKCRTCHNEKSPSYKPFKFDEMWAQIKHLIPKG